MKAGGVPLLAGPLLLGAGLVGSAPWARLQLVAAPPTGLPWGPMGLGVEAGGGMGARVVGMWLLSMRSPVYFDLSSPF